MGKIQEFFKKFLDQSSNFWKTLSIYKKLAVALVALIIFISIASIFTINDVDNRDYLYENLSSDDIKDISNELKKMRISDFIIDSKGIKVPVDKIMPLRLKLAQEGLPSHGQIGWEKFDNHDFTRTEFEQKIHRLRAIQGELARTIMSIDGVSTARVHVVMPQKSLFVEDEKEPTAAIYIKTRRGSSLSPRQIKAITHLASRSIEGLKSDKITIIDHEGKMLTKVESSDPTTKRTSEMLIYRRSVEKEMADRIRVIVGRIVGPDRVEAKVSVEVDFTREEQEIQDIDPDKVVALSTNTTNQEMSGNGLNPTGIPGSKSNVPGEQEELMVNSSRSKSKRNTENTNFEIAKQQRHRILPVGGIERITAAVLVDGSQPYPTDGSQPDFEPRTPEVMKKLEELVKTAIGFQEGRDEVIIHNILFELDPYQIQAIKEKKKENRAYIATLVVSSVIAMALVFLFAFVVRPYFRWLSYDPDRKKKEAIIEEFKPDLELGGIQNVQVKEDIPFDKLSPQEQILHLAKQEPARTTEAIRILLNPHAANH